MRNSLAFCLCVFAAFVSTDAKPWCGYYGCNEGGYDDVGGYNENGGGGYGNDGGGYENDGGGYDNNGAEYESSVYDSDNNYRSDDGYDTQSGFSGGGQRIGAYGRQDGRGDYGGGQYGGGPYGGGQYGGGQVNGGGFGNGGQGGGGGRGGGSFGGGNQGWGGNGGGQGGRRPPQQGNAYNFLPSLPYPCNGCSFRSFGEGNNNSNTFNLPKEAYLLH